MSEPLGIVACATLYAELRELVPETSIRFVPQELHELPADPPDDSAIHAAVQRRVDQFDDGSRPYIAVAYSRSNAGIGSVSAERTPLAVWRVDDCVSVYRFRRAGDAKEPGTYYLTRGWIDRGIDAYKLYLAHRGELDRLRGNFESAASRYPDLSADWAGSDRLRRISEGPSSTDAVDAVFDDLLSFFDRVVLLDTGTLRPFHHDYAERFASFLDEFSTSETDVRTEVEPADMDLLEALCSGNQSRIRTWSEFVELIPPGTAIDP